MKVAGPSSLERYRSWVDERLDSILPTAGEDLTGDLSAAMRYSALAPGKRLRPSLAMATALAVGGNEKSALDAGCAIELVHCFSLIHDDLPAIDDDDLRRGRPTCHKQYGEAMAILAGDALFALAFEVMSGCCEELGVAARCVLRLATSTGTKGLVGGEVMDILAEGGDGDLNLLKTIHARKTGALIGASCEIGAILGGANEEVVRTAAEFGAAVGLAFQIADDVLNETSTPEQLGKAVGSDRDRKKLTYPALLGLDGAKAEAERAEKAARELLGRLPGDTSILEELGRYAVVRTW